MDEKNVSYNPASYKYNNAKMSGEIISDLMYSHETFGEKFYNIDLKTIRLSGVADIIKLLISERLLDVNLGIRGKFIDVKGNLRTFNDHTVGATRKLILNMFVSEYQFRTPISAKEDTNQVLLQGTICKTVTYRVTPKGRNIADAILAVNRAYGRSDYIPCVFWGRNAVFMSSKGIGTQINIMGRLQSREYEKQLEDHKEKRMAYEVSVMDFSMYEEQTE